MEPSPLRRPRGVQRVPQHLVGETQFTPTITHCDILWGQVWDLIRINFSQTRFDHVITTDLVWISHGEGAEGLPHVRGWFILHADLGFILLTR